MQQSYTPVQTFWEPFSPLERARIKELLRQAMANRGLRRGADLAVYVSQHARLMAGCAGVTDHGRAFYRRVAVALHERRAVAVQSFDAFAAEVRP